MFLRIPNPQAKPLLGAVNTIGLMYESRFSELLTFEIPSIISKDPAVAASKNKQRINPFIKPPSSPLLAAKRMP